jgi:hypothetical protein
MKLRAILMPEHRTQANLTQVYESAEIIYHRSVVVTINSVSTRIQKVCTKLPVHPSDAQFLRGLWMTATTRLDDDARLGSLAQDSFLIFSNSRVKLFYDFPGCEVESVRFCELIGKLPAIRTADGTRLFVRKILKSWWPNYARRTKADLRKEVASRELYQDNGAASKESVVLLLIAWVTALSRQHRKV